MTRSAPLLLLALASACSAFTGPTNPGGEGGASTSSSTGGAVGGFAASAGGGTSAGGGCAGAVSKADPVPLDIFVMLDQSGSMLQEAGNGASRWTSVKSAITAFVQQPTAAGLGIGIQYFGLPQPDNPACKGISCLSDDDCASAGCTSCGANGACQSSFNPDIDSCDPADYASADVPIQPLPGVQSAIISSLGMHAPSTNTPTGPALEGAISYAKTWAEAHPDHITVVALATDGEPGSCDADITQVNAIAAAGFAGTPSIKTFVIGVGPALQALDSIAAAGGTTTAFHVDLSPNATEQFLAALNTIRGAALACTYSIPEPPAGMKKDFTLVNVEYKAGSGAPPTTIPYVKNELACPMNGLGWHYDDASAPTAIVLCAATCALLAKDAMAELDIVVGCSTIAE